MKVILSLACVLALGACGGSTSGPTGVSSSEVAALDQAAAALSTSAVTYGDATGGVTTPAECAAALQQYMLQVQPDVDRIAQMSGRMDGGMGSMGQAMGADVECGVTVMQRELARHREVACAAADMAENRAEAAHHAEAMQGYAEHMRMRAHELVAMMEESGGGAGTGMMDGGAGAGMMDGGWTTPDGRTIPYQQAMPGCTYRDGAYQPDADGGTAGATAGTGAGAS